jgi:hypothetical protein
MPDAVVIPPISTIVHLMVVEGSAFQEDNRRVQKVEAVLPRLLGSPDRANSVNGVWKAAGIRFELDRTRAVQYTPQDLGLTVQELQAHGPQIAACNPDSEHDQRVFRAIQDKFGLADFRGLQVFVWAKVRVGGGCSMSRPDGILGAVWLESISILQESDQIDPHAFRLTAHEIGHFLTLRHPPEDDPGPERLMTSTSLATNLTGDEIERAREQATIVLA